MKFLRRDKTISIIAAVVICWALIPISWWSIEQMTGGQYGEPIKNFKLQPIYPVVTFITLTVVIFLLQFIVVKDRLSKWIKNPKAIRWILLVMLLLIFRFSYSAYQLDQIKPRAHIKMYHQFRKEYKNPIKEVYRIVIDGVPYYKLIGAKDLWTITIGGPAYIFDKEGHLIDYTIDHRDDSRFFAQWYSRRLHYVISLKDLDSIFYGSSVFFVGK